MEELTFHILSGTYIGQVESWHYAFADVEIVNCDFNRATEIAKSNNAEIPPTAVFELIARKHNSPFEGKEFWTCDRSLVFPSRVKTALILKNAVFESVSRESNWRFAIFVKRICEA